MFPLDTICNCVSFGYYLQLLMAARPRHQVRYCSKCRLSVRGHVGPTGEKCTQPSSNFVADLPPELHTEFKASICQKEEKIANLSAELHHLNFTESTPIPASMADHIQPVVNSTSHF